MWVDIGLAGTLEPRSLARVLRDSVTPASCNLGCDGCVATGSHLCGSTVAHQPGRRTKLQAHGHPCPQGAVEPSCVLCSCRRSTMPPSLLQVFADDEERKEQECQRTGATADFWTSLGEGVAYCVVYFMPPRSSRIALVMMAVASTVLVAMLAATYRISDLADDVPVKHNLATASTTASSEHTALLASRGVGSEATPCCSCRRGSPLRRFAE